MPGYGFWPRSACPGWGCWCVCLGLGFSCSPLLLVLVLGRVASCVRPVRSPPPSSGAACGVGSCGGCHGWGLPTPLHFCFGLRGGDWFLALSCLGFVVPAVACPGLEPLGLRSPFPFRYGCVYVFFSRWPATSPVGCAPAYLGCPLLRWAAALGCLSPGLAGRSSGVLSGGPVGVAFGVAWLGVLFASPGVGAQLLGCVSVSCPPPLFFPAGARSWLGGGSPPSVLFVCSFFFGGGVCLFLPLPSLGWCTNWSVFGVANRVAVGAALGWAVPQPSGSGGLCTRLIWWPILSGYVLALPAGRLRQAIL